MDGKKMGKMVIDGKIVDLDNTPVEQLEEYEKLLKKRAKEINDEIDEALDI